MADDAPNEWRAAWDPLTPRGVAAFAGASFGRLFLAQLFVALLTAAAVGWFLKHNWVPIINDAIHEMPSSGGITNGQLGWSGETSTELAQNHFLGITVDLDHSGEVGRESHLQFEFGHDDLRIYSPIGYYEVIEYPATGEFPFNRTDLEPWWGARRPWILITILAAVVATLMVSWLILATLYFVPVRVVTFLEDRDLNWGQSWRLCGASCMPGAFFMITGILAYGLGWIDLIRLGGIFSLHFVVVWIYLFVSPFFCPRAAASTKGGNPFAAPQESPPSPPPANQ